MTGEEHYAEAERMLASVDWRKVDEPRHAASIAAAHVHATLALAAAMAAGSGVRVAAPKPVPPLPEPIEVEVEEPTPPIVEVVHDFGIEQVHVAAFGPDDRPLGPRLVSPISETVVEVVPFAGTKRVRVSVRQQDWDALHSPKESPQH